MINTNKEESYFKPSRKGFVTNYPNFQHWKKTAVEERLIKKPLNIYVHIPFCIQRCDYCYYRTVNLKGTERNERIDQYVEILCREIELATEHFHLQQRPVISIYFGGGTPTLLEEEHFQKILDCLGKHLDMSATSELTVEAEPVTLTQRKADMLQKFNVNRISLGVQSLCDDVIKLSNRLDTEKKALKAIEIGRAIGATVNIDLLSGMAGETPETWSYSVKRALSTEVESITVYKMELYANTEYYKGVRSQTLELPSDEQELEFMQYAIEQFQQADYLPWSFFTFTKKGQYRHVHAPSVWQGDDCYAFGTSAFGHLNNWLYQNSNDLEKYLALVQSGQLPISRGHELNSLDQMIRTVMLGMKLVSLDLTAFQKRFGFKLENLCAPVVKQLESEGFITLSENAITLTHKGILHGDYSGKSLARCLMETYGN